VQHLNQWYATYYHWEIPALEVGTVVRFYNKDDYDDAQIATIEAIDPPHQFTVRWQPAPDYPWTTLVTSFLFAEENDGVRVTISESGYETVPENERQQWLDNTGGGYTMSMENLKAYLEGRLLPH
jgi:uncharacterized protein YndB with AHSA1/START domain